MRSTFKPSISSRTSVRSCIVACMPAAAIAFAANSPVLGAVFNQTANQGLTVDDSSGVSTNRPSTNSSGNMTNDNGQPPICIHGVRG